MVNHHNLVVKLHWSLEVVDGRADLEVPTEHVAVLGVDSFIARTHWWATIPHEIRVGVAAGKIAELCDIVTSAPRRMSAA
jgi:hypothetical protein